MRAVKIIGRIFSSIVTLLLALLLAMNIYTIAARHFTGNIQPTVFGWSWAVVVSGSMSPEIEVDDLVVIHQQEEYTVGDIISYKSGQSLVTHRIVEEQDGTYTTKGDFNNTVDTNPVDKENIVGRVVKIVPGVGRYLTFLRSPLGMTLMVLLGVGIIEIPRLIRKED